MATNVRLVVASARTGPDSNVSARALRPVETQASALCSQGHHTMRGRPLVRLPVGHLGGTRTLDAADRADRRPLVVLEYDVVPPLPPDDLLDAVLEDPPISQLHHHGAPHHRGLFEHVDHITDIGDPDPSDGYALIAPPGSYPWGQGPYGTRDEAGNVAEWTADARGGFRAAREL